MVLPSTEKYKVGGGIGLPSSSKYQVSKKKFDEIKQTMTNELAVMDLIDDDAYEFIKTSYKNSWDYDDADPNDIARRELGSMPASVEEKYTTSGLDQWLKARGLPSSKNLESYIEQYNEHANKSNATSSAKQQIYSKWSDIYNEKGDLSESDAAAAYWEVVNSGEYADYLDYFKSEHDVFDEDKIYATQSEYLEAKSKFKSDDTEYDVFFRDEYDSAIAQLKAEQIAAEKAAAEAEAKTVSGVELLKSIYNKDETVQDRMGIVNESYARAYGNTEAILSPGKAETALKLQGYSDQEIAAVFERAGRSEDYNIAQLNKTVSADVQNMTRKAQEKEYDSVLDAIALEDAVPDEAVEVVKEAFRNVSYSVQQVSSELEGAERAKAMFENMGTSPAAQAAVDTLLQSGYTASQIAQAFSDARKLDYLQEALIDGQNAFEVASMEKAVKLMEVTGCSELEAYNTMTRNGLRVDEATHSMASYKYQLMDSGLDAETAQQLCDELDEETRTKQINNYAFDPNIQTSTMHQIGFTAVSVPIRAALAIASGAVNLGDMIFNRGSEESWAAAKWLTDQSAKWAEFGQDANTPILNTAGDIAAEVLRMYATAAIGGGLASAVGSSSVAATGLGKVLTKAAPMAPFIGSSMGSYYGEALASGASKRQATAYGVIAGTFEGFLESLGTSEMFGKVYSKAVLNGLVKNGESLLHSKAGQKIAGLIVSSIGEGVEEGASYVGSWLAGGITGQGWDFSGEELWQNAKMGALIGFFGSAATSSDIAGDMFGELANEWERTSTFTAEKVDKLISSVKAEKMPKQKQQTTPRQKVSPQDYGKAQAAVEKAGNTKANAEKTLQQRNEDLDERLRVSDETVERKRELTKVALEGNDTNKVSGAFSELKSTQNANEELHESVESQKVAAVKECESITANADAIQRENQAVMDAHDLAVDDENRRELVAKQAAQAVEAQIIAETVTAEQLGFSVGANLGTLNPEVSRARTNTLEAFFTEAELAMEEFAPEEFTYDKSSEVRNMMEARHRIDTLGVDANIEMLAENGMWNGADFDTAMGVLSSLREEAAWTGDYWEMQNWAKEIQTHLSKGGQLLQSAAKYSRTPEGMILEAQKNVKKAEDNATPKQKREIKEQTRIADEAIARATDEAANEAVETIVDKIVGRKPNNGKAKADTETNAEKDELEQAAEMLAKKVIAATKPKTAREENFIKQMVNDLFGVAKQTIKPQESVKEDPYRKVGKAYANREKYREVWNAAQEEIRKQILENPDSEANQMLDSDLQAYFNTGYTKPVADSAIVSLLRKGIRDMKMKMKDFIIAYDVNKAGTLSELSEYITERAGIDSSAASAMSLDLHSAFRNLRKDLAINYLKHSFSDKQNRFKNVDKLLNEIEVAGVENKNAVHDAIKHENGLPVLTDADIQGIYDNMRLMNENFAKANQLRAAGNAKGAHIAERDAKKHQELAAQIVVDKEMVTGRQKFRSIQRIMMLLNPKSNAKNFNAGVPMAAIENIKDVPAALFDVLASKFTGERTTSFNIPGKIAAQAKGFVRAFGDIRYDIKEGVDTSNRGMPGRYSLEEGGAARITNATPRIWENRVMNALNSITGTALRVGDRAHFDAAYHGRLAELEMLGKDPNTAESQKEAIRFALDRTFQNNSNLAQALGSVRNALNKLHFGSVGFGDLLMPFVQTPANIADKLIDYSGVGGTAKAIAQLIGAKKTGDFDQKLFVDRLGRSVTGFGIMALGMALAKSGALLAGADSQEEREMLDNAGVEEYAIKIGNTWHTLDWAEPAGSLLLMGAEMQKAGMSKEGFIQSAYAAGITGMDALFDLDVLQNVSAIFGGYGSVTENVGDALINSATQFVPSILNTVTKTIDPVVRDTYDENPLVETMKKMAAKVPGLSYLLPEKISTTGEVKRRSGGLVGRALQATILPNYYAVESNDPVNSELFRLYQNGYRDQMLPQAPKSVAFNLDGENISYSLSAEERRLLQQMYGEACYAKALDIIGGTDYSEYDDAKREEKLKDAISFAEQAANKKFIEQIKEQMEGGN